MDTGQCGADSAPEGGSGHA